MTAATRTSCSWCDDVAAYVAVAPASPSDRLSLPHTDYACGDHRSYLVGWPYGPVGNYRQAA